MRVATRVRSRRSTAFAVAMLAGVTGFARVPARTAGAYPTITASARGLSAPVPEVAFYRSGSTTVADATGAVLTFVPELSSWSLGGRLLAGTRPGAEAPRVVGYDARTGTRVFAVRDAMQPSVLDPGGRVAFWGTYPRDPQNNSVWMREVDGSVHKVVQFSNGGGLPGYDAGFGGDGTILGTSFDRSGSVMALAEGNDLELFTYDVFTVAVSGASVRRITADHHSRVPAVSPNGLRLAWQRDVGTCGAPYIRASRLMVSDIDGEHRKVVAHASCDGWLSGARWVSSREVVGYTTRRLGPGRYATDLVRLDVVTGNRTRLTSSGAVWFMSVDPLRRLVGYAQNGVSGFTLLDLDTHTRVRVAGQVPHLSGDLGTL